MDSLTSDAEEVDSLVLPVAEEALLDDGVSMFCSQGMAVVSDCSYGGWGVIC
jgi:hypothetical protein